MPIRSLKEKMRDRGIKAIVKQMIFACPKCGQPDATCDCGEKAVVMTKGKAADIAIYFTMAKLMDMTL